MTDYYVDLGNATFADATGVDNSANVYTGPAGLQAAIRGTGNATALAAADELFMKGTGDLGRLVLIDCAGTDVSHWAPLDVVRNKDGAGDDWTGVVVEANDDPAGAMGADDLVLVWMDTGKSASDVDVSDGIENTTQAENVDPITSAVTPGIQDDIAAAGAAGPLVFTGVNSSWTEDGTKAVWDGDSKATNCLYVGAAADRHVWRNHEWKNATGENLTGNTGAINHIFLNCDVHDSASHGTGLYPQRSLWVLCRFYNNASRGMQIYSSRAILCSCYGNGTDGFYEGSRSNFLACLAYDNGGIGFNYATDPSLALFCVADCNGTDGLVIPSVGVVLGCRATNNVQHGMEAVTASVTDLYNAVIGNIGGVTTGAVFDQTFKGASTRITSGAIGYEDVIYTFDFDNGSGTPYVTGEVITGNASGTTAVILTISDSAATGTITFRNQTGSMFLDGEQITGGTGSKTADVDGRVNVSGTPKYNLALGAAGYRTEADMGGSNYARFARGLPTVPIAGLK